MRIKVNNLNVYFGKKHILNNITFELNNGIYGLMGPNGAGKTTLMRNLVGLMKAKTGTIETDGKIGYLSQIYGAFKDFSCLEMIDYYATYREEKISRAEVLELLKMVHLENEANKKIKYLSGGMLRRLGIAQALLGNPDIIILDEPLVGLDPEERLRVKSILKNLIDNKVVIISTHIVEDIENICNQYLIMNQGELIFAGNREELFEYASQKGNKTIDTIEEGYLCIVQN